MEIKHPPSGPEELAPRLLYCEILNRKHKCSGAGHRRNEKARLVVSEIISDDTQKKDKICHC